MNYDIEIITSYNERIIINLLPLLSPEKFLMLDYKEQQEDKSSKPIRDVAHTHHFISTWTDCHTTLNLKLRTPSKQFMMRWFFKDSKTN